MGFDTVCCVNMTHGHHIIVHHSKYTVPCTMCEYYISIYPAIFNYK